MRWQLSATGVGGARAVSPSTKAPKSAERKSHPDVHEEEGRGGEGYAKPKALPLQEEKRESSGSVLLSPRTRVDRKASLE